MHRGKKELNKEVSDLEGMVNGFKNLIRVTRTNMTNQEFVERSLASHRQRIEFHQKMITQLEESLTNGDQIIADAQGSIQKLRRRIGKMKHQRDIERLLDLQRQIDKINSEE
jgi:predicted  nucleic acid-binding Zn-ribbon protein